MRVFLSPLPYPAGPGGASSVPTIDDVAGNWAAINDESGYYVPADLPDWAAHFMTPR